MFAITANLSSRAAVSLDARRSKAAKVNTTVRAATNWVLDGRNCAGARTGDVGTFKSNIVSRIQCPVTPIAVTDLCKQHQGKFIMLDAIFEQEGPDLYIYAHKPDGCVPIPNPGKRLAPARKIRRVRRRHEAGRASASSREPGRASASSREAPPFRFPRADVRIPRPPASIVSQQAAHVHHRR